MKYDIIKAGLKKQESIIMGFRNRILNAMKNEDGSVKEEYDNFHQTFTAETLAEVHILNNEIEFANHELEEIKRINCYQRHAMAEYGAIVVTDRKTFFVSAGVDELKVNNRTYIGISVYNPLYFAMKGKRVGDHFMVRNEDYLIKEIF